MALLAANPGTTHFAQGQTVPRRLASRPRRTGKTDNVFSMAGSVTGANMNTRTCQPLLALEALYYSRHAGVGSEPGRRARSQLAGSYPFIQSCQNLPEYNKEKWASSDPQNKGGFIYYRDKAWRKPICHRAASRSFDRQRQLRGFAQLHLRSLTREDPEVVAVMDLRNNYTLAENPDGTARNLLLLPR